MAILSNSLHHCVPGSILLSIYVTISRARPRRPACKMWQAFGVKVIVSFGALYVSASRPPETNAHVKAESCCATTF